MLKAALQSVKAGRVFTLNVELNFNPDNLAVDEGDLSEAERIELHDKKSAPEDAAIVPTVEIERIAQGTTITSEDLAAVQNRENNYEH